MRLSTDEDRDEERSLATIAAAADAGITVFDTARAYGDNERLLTRGLRRVGAVDTARIVTKGGMSRAGGAWIPDGRAKTIRADCEASLAALDGLPIDPSLAASISRLPAVDGQTFDVIVDPPWLDDAIDEAAFVDQREVEKSEQRHFEQALSQLERFVLKPRSIRA